MCDYSILGKSRKAEVGDKLVTQNFNLGTRGFCAAGDPGTAVCVMPGTELAFAQPVNIYGSPGPVPYKTAIFRQINREHKSMHHDMVEFPDGLTSLLTFLVEGQEATVLQLPAPPRNETEAEEQTRVEYAG